MKREVYLAREVFNHRLSRLTPPTTTFEGRQIFLLLRAEFQIWDLAKSHFKNVLDSGVLKCRILLPFAAYEALETGGRMRFYQLYYGNIYEQVSVCAAHRENKNPFRRRKTMKSAKILTILVLALAIIFTWPEVSQAAPMGTAFTYQGHLYDSNHVANGLYDFQFKLYMELPAVPLIQVGDTVTIDEVDVIDGYFTVEIDFGEGLPAIPVFDGKERLLEIGVRPGDQNDPCQYTVLSPLQEVTPTPYAMHSKNADTFDGFDSAEFAYYFHTHSGSDITSGTVAEGYIDGLIARDNEIMPEVLANDGSGSTLDADLLDGSDSTAFASSAHNHDDQYYSKAHIDALEARIAQLEALLANVSKDADDIVFSGVNVCIINGTGSTENTNGLGNLIVGYNELRGGGDDRSGSHNIVVGKEHNYSSYGGLVGGIHNTVSGVYAAVSGGRSNTASGDYASVSGGSGNEASGEYAGVSGGRCNQASGDYSFVVGGGWEDVTYGNKAFGHYTAILGGHNNFAGDPELIDRETGRFSTVSGGRHNEASGYCASVNGGSYNDAFGAMSAILGGQLNIAGDPNRLDHGIGTDSCVSGGSHNRASGDFASASGGSYNEVIGECASISGGGGGDAIGYGSSISGGGSNRAYGHDASISGGNANEATGDYACVSGGQSNDANGTFATVSGGYHNEATDFWASVSGGWYNEASAYYTSVTGGRNNHASGEYSSVTGGQSNKASGYCSFVGGGGGEDLSPLHDYGNKAVGDYSAILGGKSNIAGDPNLVDHAIGIWSCVSAGENNNASGDYASVSGGSDNAAQDHHASISGGYLNTASFIYASVSGGMENTADGGWASVSGGYRNKAHGSYSSISGGYNNEIPIATGFASSISGGRDDTVAANYSWRATDNYYYED